MSNTACRCLSFDPTRPVHRRAVLRGTGQGGLAAGLLAAGLSPLLPPGGLAAGAPAGRLQEEACPDLRVFAKKSFQIDAADVGCGEPCACGDNKVYRIVQDLGIALTPTACDETASPIPDGTVLRVHILRSLRVPGPDGTWVGSHEGEFVLDAPGGPVEGQLWGISGIHSDQGGCRNPERDEGLLTGQGRGDLDGCRLVASYRSEVQFADPTDPCSIDWGSWDLDVRGILTCPCDGGDDPNGGQACIDFEGQRLQQAVAAGVATYVVGDTFDDAGVTMEVQAFQDALGAWTSDGSVEVVSGGQAGGSGLEANIRAANLTFDFGGPLSTLTLVFGETGGNVNLEVNGDFRNAGDFPDVDGVLVGGVNVSVIPGSTGQQGTLKLDGAISSFAVGGEELWIDDVCVS